MQDLGSDNKGRANVALLLVLLVGIWAVFVPISSAGADDTMARVAAGEITFVQSQDVRMLKEILQISTREIRVRFTFLNESARDIHTTVAFPLPLIRNTEHWNVEERLVGTFKVLVNGSPVQTTVVRKAIIAEKDVTPRLFAIGLSRSQIFSQSKIAEVMRDLTPRQKAFVKKLGGDLDQFPPWNVAATMIWHQTFPAGKEIEVEHSYAPIVGAVYTVPFYEGSFSDSPWMPSATETSDEACLDEMTRQSIKKKVRAHATNNTEQVCVTLHHVEYILGTGRNWKGPIGEFTLRIEKETPDQIVSLSFPGKPKEISPTVYEFHQRDFVPQDRLVVYFYMVGPHARDPHDI
jgi:hypothetical protein